MMLSTFIGSLTASDCLQRRIAATVLCCGRASLAMTLLALSHHARSDLRGWYSLSMDNSCCLFAFLRWDSQKFLDTCAITVAFSTVVLWLLSVVIDRRCLLVQGGLVWCFCLVWVHCSSCLQRGGRLTWRCILIVWSFTRLLPCDCVTCTWMRPVVKSAWVETSWCSWSRVVLI